MMTTGTDPWSPARRTWAVFGAAWLVFYLVMTLVPGDPTLAVPRGFCLICGTRGFADAILNIVATIPLGASLSGIRAGRRWKGVALLLPLLVELAQTQIAGRHASGADIVLNQAGIIAGLYGSVLWRWLEARGRGVPLLVWAGLVAAIPFGLGLTRVARLPAEPYYVHWNPDLRVVAPFPGQVADASVGGSRLARGGPQHGDPVRRILENGDTLRVTFARAPGARSDRVEGLLGIWNDDRKEVMLLGRRGDGLVLRTWTWGAELRLNVWHPAIPLGANLLEGDGAGEIEAWRGDDDQLCAGWGGSVSCQRPLAVARWWSALVSPPPGRRLGASIDVALMVLLFLPLVVLPATPRLRLLAATGALAAFMAAPLFLPLGRLQFATLGPVLALLLVGWSARGAYTTLLGRRNTRPEATCRG